ncbi:N-acetyltransferase ECO1 [Paracoccidioides lutzii Pb01]|uniref:N-acetyltransferase ECO1 n=1 Tax=Paracoccidioides lutzii (strain ATCC MYA-826 / Pb01) TaxID=502779 RepID=C1H5D1_PARBA|nr:N-acetyltransferase ECO1 [Paracoccidioides lutzii Pb01]EEH34925.1 N-acetyltransferase ECO1 [Paracoccidioides lutzii Pb01]
MTPFMVSVRDMPYTVTNSFKRGLMMHTYGRPLRRVFDEETRPATKKRRVDLKNDNPKDSAEDENNLECAIRESSAAVLSSPSRRTSMAFSEDLLDDDLSTPPSSPPLQLTPPPVNTRKPTFSFLKRKRASNNNSISSNGAPLTEVNFNSVRAATDPPPQKLPKQQRQIQSQPPLKQMQIDLGVDIRKTCATCGMEYIPSNAEDVVLHKKFHDMNSSGVDLGKAFVRANACRWVYEAARFDEGYVVIVDRKSSPSARKQAIRVLEVVNKELSAPDIEDSVLWSQTEPPERLRKNGSNERADRFKVFLHMKDSKCVGLCLTERIWESHVVKRPEGTGNDGGQLNGSSITVSKEAYPAVVGISRVWTSASSRRMGIAMDLLDCVVSNYIYGMEIPKSQIAFSQPTESGCRLIEAFFGPDEQWRVYKEN